MCVVFEILKFNEIYYMIKVGLLYFSYLKKKYNILNRILIIVWLSNCKYLGWYGQVNRQVG